MDIKHIPRGVLYFLTICGLGLCCHSGDVEVDGKCYLLSRQKFDFRSARLICQIYEGDLAFINSSRLISIIASGFTKPAFDQGISYWVKELSYVRDTIDYTKALNNPVSNRTSRNHQRLRKRAALTTCPYLKNKTIDLQDCSQANMVLCEYDARVDNMSCPQDWDLYGRYCFMRSTIQTNYAVAVSFCSSHRGRLAVLDSESKEKHGKSIVAEKNLTYFVGAKRIDGNFKWSNCQDFNPACPSCINGNSEMQCMGLLSESAHPTMFSWERINCSENHYFICENDAENRTAPAPDQSYSACKIKTTTPIPVQNSTETTTLISNQTSTVSKLNTDRPLPVETSTALLSETTSVSFNVSTTLKSLICPDPRWKRHMEFCYWNSDVILNWYEARTYCQGFGGDLLTYHTKSEESQIILSSKENYTDHWFGLLRWRDDGKFRWVDGSPVTYTNWKVDEPRVEMETHFCVKYSEDSETWMLDYCGKRKRFLCAAPLGRNTIEPNFSFLTRKKCNITTTSAFREWYSYGDNCYLVAERNLRTWNSALTFCINNGANLASIHSSEETNFILTILNVETKTDFWIGLKADFSSSFTWSDDTPLDFLYFANQRVVKSRLHNCVIFNKEDGSWTSTDCNQNYGVICKRSNDHEFTSPAPTAFSGNCQKGWYLLGNKCYIIFGQHGFGKLIWHDAKRACEKHGAVLATIHSEKEQNFLTDLMIEAGSDIWIGLQSHNLGTIFKWADGTRLDYTNWNADNVKSKALTRDVCLEIMNKFEADGKWEWQECYKKSAYVCEKSRGLDIENITERNNFSECSREWKNLGSSSSYIFKEDTPLSWNKAMAYCLKHGGNLASFHSIKDVKLVQDFLNHNFQSRFLHIGLTKNTDGSYAWVDHSPLDFTHWAIGQPDYKDDCVEMIVEDGKWNDIDCDKTKRGFICSTSRIRDCFVDGMAINSTNQGIYKNLTTGGIVGIAIGIFGIILVILALRVFRIYNSHPKRDMRSYLLENEESESL
ncbi:macrophage mannose receptor 1-like isoform X2 [Stegodyphus dumicola]|uniref:macrophage mannose receptor 1-like isoform X2 n=1 Tax=Stegodyphus dumicola TaxID=202533 RepID=UPI0015B09059|nr:macrophage mannose receptor 1-like isoform X2 [Stegodyphus dumicola]